jgi:hypothetical protein
LRAEIIDWTIPAEVDPATGDTLALGSDDVLLQNNNAQKNVFDFEALAGSPYEHIEFEFSVHNDALWPETAYLLPSGLPWGSKIEITPAEAVIASGDRAIFRCRLTLDDHIIRPGCNNDQGFLLTAWRIQYDGDEKWGSCFYFVRPRLKTEVEITRGYWQGQRLLVIGLWRVVSEQPFDLVRNPPGIVRVRMMFAGHEPRTLWRTATIDQNGVFQVDLGDADVMDSPYVDVQVFYDRTVLYGSSVSSSRQIKRYVIE